MSEHGAVTVIRPRKGLAFPSLRELWRRRELLYFLTWRDVKVRYKQTVLGILWAVIQPFLMMVLFTALRRLGRIPSSSGVPVPLFIYAGVLPWTFFAQALGRASNCLAGSPALLTKACFPRLVMPVSAVLSALVDFGFAFAVYLGLMLYYGVAPGWEVLLVPGYLALAALAALGTGLWLSALNVKYRDVRHAIPFFIWMWLFVSPVIYSTRAIPERFRVLYSLNPMVGVIGGFRWSLLGEGMPHLAELAASFGVLAAVLFGGLLYFGRMERTFADVV